MPQESRRKDWERFVSKGDLEEEEFDHVLRMFNDQIDEVGTLADTNAEDAYATLMGDVAFINHELQIASSRWPFKQADIIDRLKDWISKLEVALKRIAEGLKRAGHAVGGFSVGVSGPMLGVWASIWFSVT